MESYPLDLLQHLTPTLMVGGLLAAPAGDGSAPESASLVADPDVQKSTQISAPAASPPASGHSVNQPWAKILSKLLMQTTGSNTPTAIWDPPRPIANLQVMLVDKRVFRFPPRKRPPRTPSDNITQTQLHSPLSPLSPGSPLFPDGIMSPIWIRKHREMCPAVWVDFYELKDKSTTTADDVDAASSAEPLGIRAQTPQQQADIKKLDAELVKEILKTRRHVLGGISSSNERGAYAGAGKYAVVVCLQPHHMTSPNIEARLSGIRQDCNLDNRTLLYLPLHTTTPTDTPNQELTDFISSLAIHLNESTIAHFRDNTKRVRRKKAKVLPPALPPHAVAELRSNPNSPPPLGAQGWHMRYEYKLGCFAEFRGEIDVANKHYETCHSQLLEMFASTVTLPPRTKRWAEAKVLADCLNLKICKLYMYMDGTTQAMAQFNMHIARFREFSNGWGIGVDTFEYWAWLCKQYRALGDLVDMALRNGYKLPTPGIVPPTAQAALTIAASAGQHQPLNTLQHAGYYYYAAARCTVERMKRFKRWIEAEGEEGDVSLPRKGDTPALTNERKLDHWELVIELLTKAYEQFKRMSTRPTTNAAMPLSPRGGPSSGHSRLTLFLAAEIANAYAERNRPGVEGHQLADAEMALKFYERIAKTYRRDGWYDILGTILFTTRDCARQLKRWDLVLETCLEQLSPNFGLNFSERTQLQDEMDRILSQQEAESTLVHIDLAQAPCFLGFQMHFQETTSHVGHSIPYQFCIYALQGTIVREIGFDRVEIHFNDAKVPPVILNHSKSASKESNDGSKSQTRLWKVSTHPDVDLTIRPLSVDVFEGVIMPQTLGDLMVSKVILKMTSSAYTVELSSTLQTLQITQRLDARQHWFDGSHWAFLPGCKDYTKLNIAQQPPNIMLKVDTDLPAFVDEVFPLNVSVTNNEEETIRNVILDVKLVTAEGEEAATLLRGEHDEISGNISLEALSLGDIEVNSQSSKTVYLIAKDHTGDRTLTMHVSYHLSSSLRNGVANVADEDDELASSPGMTAALQIVKTEVIVVPIVRPFTGRFQLESDFESGETQDLLISDPTAHYWLHSSITNEAPAEVHIIEQNVEWAQSATRTKWTSLTDERVIDKGEMDWSSGCIFNSSHMLEMTGSSTMPIGWYVIRWRRGDGAQATTRVPIEGDMPSVDSLRIIARLPSKVELQIPFTVTYEIVNESAEMALLQLSVEPPTVTDSCVYSGTKSKQVLRVPAYSTDNPPLHQTIIPLHSGRLVLPRLVAVNTRRASAESGAVPVPVPVRCTGKKGDLSVWVMPRFKGREHR